MEVSNNDTDTNRKGVDVYTLGGEVSGGGVSRKRKYEGKREEKGEEKRLPILPHSEVDRERRGRKMLEFEIGQSTVEAQIDNGSEVSTVPFLISEGWKSESLWQPTTGKEYSGLHPFGGQYFIPIEEVLEFQIEVGGQRFYHKFHVVDRRIEASVLLGRDFVDRRDVRMKVKAGVETVKVGRGREVEVKRRLEGGEGTYLVQGKLGAQTMGKVTIPPKALEYPVKVRVLPRRQEGELVMLEPILTGAVGRLKGLIVGRTVCRIDVDGCAYIPVTNPRERVTVLKGQTWLAVELDGEKLDEESEVFNLQEAVKEIVSEEIAQCRMVRTDGKEQLEWIKERKIEDKVLGEKYRGLSEEEVKKKLEELGEIRNKVVFGDRCILTAAGRDKMQLVVEDHTLAFSEEGKWAGTVDNCMIPIVDIDTGVAAPKADPPRKLGQFKRKAALDRIRELLEADLIHLSTSEWAAAVVVVVKGGKIRLAIDYRQLNSVTRKDMNRLPPMKEVLAALGGSRYFSVVDISNYFHQFPLTEQAALRTAFLAPDGLLYQWAGMPFGLVNAPAIAARTAALILAGLNWLKCLVYIDDIIIHSRDEESHIGDVAGVLNRVGKAGLKLKLAKCEFGVCEVKYLGYMASNTGLRKDPAKVEAVSNWPRPEKGKDLHTFLAFCGFYRCFIKGFSKRIESLSIYTTSKYREVPVDWTDIRLAAFLDLKNAMCEEVCLAYPDYSVGAGRLVVRTDACPTAIGAVLGQIDCFGRLRPIEFISKTLTSSEMKWHITELEGLAVVWALEKWKGYLEGHKFDLHTDHNALLSLQFKTNPHGRLERWMILLQQFDCTIYHIPGRYMTDADALSRREENPSPSPVITPELEFITDISDCGEMPGYCERTYEEMVRVRPVVGESEVKVESEILEKEVVKCDVEVERNVKVVSESAVVKRVENVVVVESVKQRQKGKRKMDMSRRVEKLGAEMGVERFRKEKGSELVDEEGEKVKVDLVEWNDDIVECNQMGVVEESRARVYAVSVRTKEQRKENMRKKMQMRVDLGEEVEVKEEFEELITREEMIKRQQNDEGIVGEIYRYLVEIRGGVENRKERLSELASSYISVCDIIDDMLVVARDPFGKYGVQRHRVLIFVPDKLQQTILGRSHTTYQSGHPQVDKLYRSVGGRYYWRGMYSMCEKVVRECLVCQAMQGYGKRREGSMQPMTADAPNEQIGLDLIVMPVSSLKYRYILVIVCYFTKYCRAIALEKKNMESIAVAFFLNWLLPYGAPDRIVSDQGTEFVNTLFKRITELAGVVHRVTTPYHPQANGQVESTNKLIVRVIRFIMNRSQDNWDRVLPIAEAAVNTRQHPATLETPFFLWHLREYRLPHQLMVKQPVSQYLHSCQFVHELMSDIDNIYERTRLNILMDKNDRKEYYDSVYGKMRLGFRVGDKVWLYTPKIVEVEGKQGLVREKSKLARTWEGPFRVVKLVGTGPPYNDYCIQFMTGQKLRQVVNVNRLKPYYGEDDDEEKEREPEIVEDKFDVDQEKFVQNRGRYWNVPLYKERPEEDEELESNEFEIERIIDMRRTGRGKNKKIEFRVKWSGYTEKENSWVREDEVEANDILTDFRREWMMEGKKVDF